MSAPNQAPNPADRDPADRNSGDRQDEIHKAEIRAAAHAARRAQPHKDALSRLITDRARVLAEFKSAATMMCYIGVRDEVQTRPVLAEAVRSGHEIAIPYCVDGRLHLFLLESMDELETGAYRIPEPRVELRANPSKQISVERIDLILVPGLAFDPQGGRIGYGKGYYDKLLAAARRDTPLVALAFDCQIFASIPMQSHDIYMDLVVTESTVHRGRGRQG